MFQGLGDLKVGSINIILIVMVKLSGLGDMDVLDICVNSVFGQLDGLGDMILLGFVCNVMLVLNRLGEFSV